MDAVWERDEDYICRAGENDRRKEGSSSIQPETTHRCDACNKDCHSHIGLDIQPLNYRGPPCWGTALSFLIVENTLVKHFVMAFDQFGKIDN